MIHVVRFVLTLVVVFLYVCLRLLSWLLGLISFTGKRLSNDAFINELWEWAPVTAPEKEKSSADSN